MRGGGLIAGLLMLGGYLGFEVAMISKAGYRMEANYIYPMLVSARTATLACGEVGASQLAGFDHVMETSRQRLLGELAEAGSDSRSAAREAEALKSAAQAQLRSLLDTAGCAAPEVRRSIGQFQIYARRAPRIAREAVAGG